MKSQKKKKKNQSNTMNDQTEEYGGYVSPILTAHPILPKAIGFFCKNILDAYNRETEK